MTEKDKFEAWERECGTRESALDRVGDSYSSHDVTWRWRAWQASRSSLTATSAADASGAVEMRDDIASLIRDEARALIDAAKRCLIGESALHDELVRRAHAFQFLADKVEALPLPVAPPADVKRVCDDCGFPATPPACRHCFSVVSEPPATPADAAQRSAAPRPDEGELAKIEAILDEAGVARTSAPAIDSCTVRDTPDRYPTRTVSERVAALVKSEADLTDRLLDGPDEGVERARESCVNVCVNVSQSFRDDRDLSASLRSTLRQVASAAKKAGDEYRAAERAAGRG